MEESNKRMPVPKVIETRVEVNQKEGTSDVWQVDYIKELHDDDPERRVCSTEHLGQVVKTQVQGMDQFTAFAGHPKSEPIAEAKTLNEAVARILNDWRDTGAHTLTLTLALEPRSGLCSVVRHAIADNRFVTTDVAYLSCVREEKGRCLLTGEITLGDFLWTVAHRMDDSVIGTYRNTSMALIAIARDLTK